MTDYMGTDGADTIRGGGEDDYIVGGAGNDRLYGDGGRDEIDPGSGDDIAYGGNGNDSIYARGGGDDRIYGEAGDDSLSIDTDGAPTQSGIVDGGAGNDTISYYGTPESTGAVTLIGGDGADTISTVRGGSITINAGAGNDQVSVSGSSGVTVALGAGHDVLALSAGGFGVSDIKVVRVTDFAAGDNGDRLDLTSILNLFQDDPQINPFATGNMRVVEVSGAAVLQARQTTSSPFYDVVRLEGVSANALIAQNFSGYDPAGGPVQGYTVYGTEGDDILGGSEQADNLYGGAGDDSLYGQAGDDRLYGELGNDRLIGRDGSDIMDGGAGDDTFIDGEEYFGQGVTGSDTFIGGAGFDTVIYLQATTLDVTGSNDTAAAVGDSFTSIEAYVFKEGDNTILGSNANETFTTAGGADVINGGGGADIMSGGLGADTYYVDNAGDLVIEAAGGGVDTVFSSVSFRLGAYVENLTLTGSAGTA
ncbi:MAG: calcium-binding protein, partial [Brevundimonas sp.]